MCILQRPKCSRAKGKKDGLMPPGRSFWLYLTSFLSSLFEAAIPAVLAANASKSVHHGCARELSSSVMASLEIDNNNVWSVVVVEVSMSRFFAVLEVQFGCCARSSVWSNTLTRHAR